jgi:hypothetical protein
MTQTIRPCMPLGASSHWVGLATQSLARMAVWTGLFTIGIFATPVVIALNLLTKFLSAIADRDR